MAVLTTVPTPLDPTHVVVDLDTDWPPTDTPVKVVTYVAWRIIFGGANFHGRSEKAVRINNYYWGGVLQQPSPKVQFCAYNDLAHCHFSLSHIYKET